jgi:hypothetical protein
MRSRCLTVIERTIRTQFKVEGFQLYWLHAGMRYTPLTPDVNFQKTSTSVHSTVDRTRACESSPRMGGVVGFLQSLGSQVRVDLRGDEVRVAEQFLHAAQVRAGIEQMRGVTVPQFMRRE